MLLWGISELIYVMLLAQSLAYSRMIFCGGEKAEILTLNENPTYVSDKRVRVLREVERNKFVRMSSRKMNILLTIL